MPKKILQGTLRALAIAILASVYGATLLASRLLRRRAAPRARLSGRILVIATFHNPNWFHAHVRPLVRSGVGEVILVCDELVELAEGVRFECPPRALAAVLTRAGAKLAWALRCAFKYRPDLYMGFHIFPGALSALLLARLFGRPACYQDTSGPLELAGGGWHGENRLLRALQRPSAIVERLVNPLVDEFDSVVVRGSGAQAYVRGIGYGGTMAVITGSVAPAAWLDFPERSIDLAFVGRLAEVKRPERFIAVAAQLAKALPHLRAAIIGTGPLLEPMKALARELGVESNVEFLGQRSDVDELIARSRVFLLTSRSEGLSIAMLEAMASGAVPVVSDVGDLADIVEHGCNGYLVAQDDIAGYSHAALGLLTDAALWRRLSSEARACSLETAGVEAIAARWRQHLQSVLAAPRGNGSVASSSSPV
jgi:glycosyltransferase involved in cell wall biosynthesis